MPISFHAIGSSPPFGRCSSATATSGSTTSGSATSAIGWASRRGAPRSRSARDVLPGVSRPAWAPRRRDRRRRGGRAEGARPALGRCACHRGESRDHAPPGGARGAWLAIAGTDDRAANAQVWAEAEREGVLLNAVDDLYHCSFIAPAIHREGDITVAVSTSGKSPALVARLRQRVARLIGPAEARLCELLGELRPEVAARVPDTRARTTLWYRIVDSDVIEFVRRGDMDGARERIDELVSEVGPLESRLKPRLGSARERAQHLPLQRQGRAASSLAD